MTLWHLNFSIGNHKWTNEVRNTEFKVLKRDVDAYIPDNRYKLDFLPLKEDQEEEGLYTIVDNLKPIGQLQITQIES